MIDNHKSKYSLKGKDRMRKYLEVFLKNFIYKQLSESGWKIIVK